MRVFAGGSVAPRIPIFKVSMQMNMVNTRLRLTLPHQEHADSWLSHVKLLSDKTLGELDSARDEASLRVVDDCPVRYIREVKEDGTDVFIGDVAIIRCPFMDLTSSSEISQEEKDRLLAENVSRPAGDPKIVWTIGSKFIWVHFAAQSMIIN